MMIKKFLDPKNDYAFKQIFGQEKNKDILIRLINAVLRSQLHRKVVDVTFLNPVQEPEVLAKKQSIVDVLCKDQDGCQYIIEMQVANTSGFEERAQYYASKAYVSQMGEGGLYYGLKKVIFLAFTNFSIFPTKEHYKSEHVTLDKKTLENNLNKISFTFVDLVKFDKMRTEEVNDLTLEEKFYYFLRHATEISEENMAKLIKQNSVIDKAFGILRRISVTEEERFRYEREEKRLFDLAASYDFQLQQGFTEGLNKGLKQGKEEGLKQGKIELIQALVQEGLISEEEAQKRIAALG